MSIGCPIGCPAPDRDERRAASEEEFEAEEAAERDPDDLSPLALEPAGGCLERTIQVVGNPNGQLCHLDSRCSA
jgi:hypothetical protein